MTAPAPRKRRKNQNWPALTLALSFGDVGYIRNLIAADCVALKTDRNRNSVLLTRAFRIQQKIDDAIAARSRKVMNG